MKHLTDNEGPVASHMPNFRAKNVAQINFKTLKAKGIESVAIDIDGTLVEVGSLRRVDQKFIKHITDAQKGGYINKTIIATNRLAFIANMAYAWFDVDAVVAGKLFSRKPSRSYYKRLIARLGSTPEKSIMIGDRLWQDIYGANKAGMWTILVDDLGREPWYDRLMLHRYRQNRKLKELLANLKTPQ